MNWFIGPIQPASSTPEKGLWSHQSLGPMRQAAGERSRPLWAGSPCRPAAGRMTLARSPGGPVLIEEAGVKLTPLGHGSGSRPVAPIGPAGTPRRPRPSRSRRRPKLLCAVLLGAAVLATACGAGSPTGSGMPTSNPASSIPRMSVPPLAAGRCADDQPDRYVAEIFDVAAVETLTYTDSLQADLYRPAQDPATCRVGVVWVHGGGFTQASRDGTAEQAWGAQLARRGYLLASIDYRLGTGQPFGLDQALADPQRRAVVDGAIADAAAALAWMTDAATELGVDPARVAIGGTSAGGVIALGAGLTAADGARPCTIVSVAGDLDGGWVGADPPPVLLIHGDADQLVPYTSSVDARSVLTGNGGTAELVTIAGAGHEITGPPTDEMVSRTAGWLREQAAAGCR